ncbi:MAG: tetratricopeptide repeat protein [Acidobacteriota bacterium]|nr:tetratricopeptide repeat protein [Acidobacteriota bacterium]
MDLLLAHSGNIDPLQLHLTLGTAYALLPDTVRLHQHFDAAAQMAPGQSAVHAQYGRALMTIGELQPAREELQQALSLNPADVETLYSLALLDGREGQFASASATLSRAIALTHDPARLRLYYRMAGQMYLLSHNWNAARDAFTQALRLNPHDEPSLAGLGNSLEELNRPKEAAAALTQAVARDPTDATAWEHLGRVETTLDDCASASAAYARLNQLRPKDRSTLSHWARALIACGRKSEAAEPTAQLRALVQDEVALGDKGPELTRINAEAIAFEQKGDYPAAERNYRHLVELDPGNLIFHRNLGLVLCRQSHWPEGISELKQALSLDPDDLDSQRALNAALSASNTQP